VQGVGIAGDDVGGRGDPVEVRDLVGPQGVGERVGLELGEDVLLAVLPKKLPSCSCWAKPVSGIPPRRTRSR